MPKRWFSSLTVLEAMHRLTGVLIRVERGELAMVRLDQHAPLGALGTAVWESEDRTCRVIANLDADGHWAHLWGFMLRDEFALDEGDMVDLGLRDYVPDEHIQARRYGLPA